MMKNTETESGKTSEITRERSVVMKKSETEIEIT